MRLGRGRPQDPAWARPALLGVLALTAVLYLWDLGASGWANSFYAAAVEAGAKSWKAFFFGSFDSSNFITVDKPPASLWVMDISARIFGVNSWSILVPQALEGVAAVGVVYVTVRRWASAGAGLIAAVVMALTPVAALMFRYNNPDALLVLLLCLGADALTVATEKPSLRWLLLAFALVGLGFMTKMLQAYLVVPAMAATFFVAAPTGWWRRTWHLALGGVALLVSSFWWVMAVMAVPAADRPYIGSSQDNSLWNLIFGYNGLGRLTGNENGSVAGGAPGTASRWGLTGLTRLFGSEMGTQISWLLPAALVLLAVVIGVSWRHHRTSVLRASVVLWGGWLLVTGVAFSMGQGIIHPYYNVALAPAIGAVVGTGAWALWQRRSSLWARLVMAGVVGLTGWWSSALLDRAPTWHPDLRAIILAAAAVGALALVVFPYISHRATSLVARAGALGVTAVAVLLGPASYSLATAATPHSGAIPSAGPAGNGGPPGGFSGFAFRRNANFPPGGAFPGGASPAGGNLPGGAFPGNGGPPNGGFPGAAGRPPGLGGPGAANGFGGGRGGFGGGRGGFGGGGLLNGSTPNTAITDALKAGASKYTWVAAVVGANQASGYQLAADEPVMAIAGFNGTDPAPSLAQFEKDVSEHKVHYFIASGGFGPRGGAGSGGQAVSAQIASWVEANFASSTVGGVTVYNLAPGAN